MKSYHMVIIGSGFASTFFLYEYLRRAAPGEKILVLERGPFLSHETRVAKRMIPGKVGKELLALGGDPGKEWSFTIGFGGSSACWWASTPRLHPNDFKLKSLYGVGRDWPISYDDLEEDYCNAEDIMQVSGGPDSPYPRSRPYPQPPHNFTDPDRLLKAKYPDLFFHQPTARARVATKSRPACCANGLCQLCPVDAKFTIENELSTPYKDPRVELRTEAEALGIDFGGGLARSVRYREDNREQVAAADIVVLGANAIFNPYLMLKSGMAHPLLGRGLAEQTSTHVDIDLKGVENFQGSTSLTGYGYMFYDGEHRRVRGACLVESKNMPTFRLEPGRWRERLTLRFMVEDLPQHDNRVEIDPSNPDPPLAVFQGFSPYAQATMGQVADMAAEVVAGLPVEKVHPPSPPNSTDSHIQCTTPMGADPANSLVDAKLISHSVRNLVVLGSSTFPTVAPALPTLTICALSMYAARRLVSSGAN